jgi:hypothetical protein
MFNSYLGGRQMGEVIRKSAAAIDIIADVRSTLTQSRARGGTWQSLAESRLGALTPFIDSVEARLAAAEAELVPLVAAVGVRDDEADRLLGRISDEIWNDVGRPAADPALSILFPNGIAYYAQGNEERQPERMSLLAELLESNLHPRLPADKAKGYAQAIRVSADALGGAWQATREPSTRVELLTQIRRALASNAQTELVGLKRLYRSERFSDADIHAVIPDRPASGKKPAHAQSPAPAAAKS